MTEFEGQIKDLSKLIYNWNLINSASKSELDEFSKKLLNALDKEENEEKIIRIIETELCVRFGLYKTEFDSTGLAKQVIQWRNN